MSPAASSAPPEWSDVRRSGPALALHHGTWLAGGVIWLAPLVFVPAAVLALGRGEWAFAAVMGGLGLATAAPLIAAWKQTVELFPRHLVWTKWGRARTVAYSDIREIRSGMRAQTGQGARAGLIEQRFVDLHLCSGETITWIEMSRHTGLCEQLAQCLAAVQEGAELSAAARDRRGRGG